MPTLTEARSLIRSGDLLAWEPRPWPETPQWWLVRAATGNKLCHVGVAFVRRRTQLLIESDIPHVRMQRMDERLPVWWLPLGVPQRADWVDGMLELIGTPYAYLDAVRQWLGMPTADTEMTCLELVRVSLLLAGAKAGGLRDLMPDALMAKLAERAKAEPVLLT
jgi:hypothetical protein